MEGTPKLQKKASLSLSRLTNSPKNRECASNNAHSPSVRLCTETNFQTPPHRKLHWDESSLDYSPSLFDTSFSPNALLSQTLAIDSPEVGWKWTEATPDSAYPDSSFNSAGSSSTESKTARTKREEQRKAMEIKLRRAEKMRTDELLKRRCAKLQEQLRCSSPSTSVTRQIVSTNTLGNTESPRDSGVMSLQSTKLTHIIPKDVAPKTAAPQQSNTFSDFFNDSDSDCLLLAATQQMESTIVELTQKVAPAAVQLTTSAPAVVTPSSKNKRSSLYLKFLEEDSPEDWFESLDEVIKEATQAKKARTLQRYKSLPITTAAATTIGNAGTATHTTTAKSLQATVTSSSASCTMSTATTASASTKLKRHASSHAPSPSGTGCKSRAHFKTKH